MKKYLKIVYVVALCVIAMACYPKVDFALGISADRYEQDARAVLEIPDDWHVAKAVTEDCVAVLFYNADRSDNKFSIYESNRGSFLLGKTRVIRGVAGIDPDIVEEVWTQTGDTVCLSLNSCGVKELVFLLNGTEKAITFDAAQPFVCIVPHGYEKVQIYTDDGNIFYDFASLYDRMKNEG